MSTPNSLPPNLSILPHLEQLTVRASISCFHDRQFYRRVRGYESESESLFCESPLTTILKLLETGPPLKKLTLRLDLHLVGAFSLWDVDWSPLACLANIFPLLRPINLCLSATKKQMKRRVSMRPSEVRSLIMGEPVLGMMVRQGLLVIQTEEVPPERIALFLD